VPVLTFVALLSAQGAMGGTTSIGEGTDISRMK